jgi:ABC-type transport system involved in multi-copper enzyme maturation permease subunit
MTTAILARTEWIKTTRRLAFWVTLLCLGALTGIVYFERRPELGLPGAWSDIVGEPGPLPGMAAAILIILLVANEFSWRTARQNVIDGLSRSQFYGGKTLLLPAVSLVVFGMVMALGTGMALWSTDPAALADGVMSRHDLAFLGGGFLSVAGLTAMALLVASLLRSAGSAIALFFFYIAFAEQILAMGVARVLPAAEPYLVYRPADLFMSSLTRSAHYYPAEQQAAITAALEKGGEAPTFLDPGVMAAVGAAWIVAFVLVGFLAFRRRDL